MPDDRNHEPGPTRELIPPPYLDARDHFAGLALQGELAACSDLSDPSRGYQTTSEIAGLAKWAYRVADQMLLAREAR